MSNMAKAVAGQSRQEWDPTRLYAAGENGALLLFDQPVRSGVARLPGVGGSVEAVADALPGGATTSDYAVTSWGGADEDDPGDSITDNGDGSVSVTKAANGGVSAVWSNQSAAIAVGEVWEIECDLDGDIAVQIGLADATNARSTTFSVSLSGPEKAKGLVLVDTPDATGEVSVRTTSVGSFTASNARARRVLGVHGVQASTSLRPIREQVDGDNALRLDHVDDKLTLTFPEGLTGADVYIAGRNGSWLESGIDVSAGGTLDLGPLDSPGGVARAVEVLGDLVGLVVVERALTAVEKALLADYFRGRGARGLLVPDGTELVTNGGFDTDFAGWDVWGDASTVLAHDTGGDGGRMEVQPGTAFDGSEQVLATEAGALYLFTSRIERTAIVRRYFDGKFVDTDNSAGTDSRSMVVAAAGASSALRFYSGNNTGAFYVEDVSVQRLVPEEDL